MNKKKERRSGKAKDHAAPAKARKAARIAAQAPKNLESSSFLKLNRKWNQLESELPDPSDELQ